MASTLEADVQYVNTRYERSVREDGRRCHSWFLIDQHGTEHLAVVGIETDTMDGHYAYSALEPFASQKPLNCGNQAGVSQYLQQWLAGIAGEADNDEPHSATHSGGTSSGCITGGQSSGRRKAFVSSLCSSRQAVMSAAGTSPIHYHGGGGSGRGKVKSKQAAVATYATDKSAPKQKSVGIVQQNQIKKARKIQEDIRAEQDRLVSGHVTCLRRAAAAELQTDNAAKQITMSWLQGSLSHDELDAVEHWRALLSTVLDLQQQQQQQCEQPQGNGNSIQQLSGSTVSDENGANQQQPQQLLQTDAQQKLQGKGTGGNGAAAAGSVPAKLLAWLHQPDSRQHYLRVVLECLRELAAAEIPARILLQRKLIALVQRCRCQQQDEAVRSLAQHILTRWRWQLAGHMQVLTTPVYMEDHVGVLQEEVAAGQVPLPQLPKYKQVLLSTTLPALPGGPGSRSTYTPTHNHCHHHHHHHLQQTTSSTPQVYDPAVAAAAASGGGGGGLQGYPGYPAEGAAAGYDGTAGYLGFNPGSSGYYTPMPSLYGVQQADSPASGVAGLGQSLPGQQHQLQQHHMGLFASSSGVAQVAQYLPIPGQMMMPAGHAGGMGAAAMSGLGPVGGNGSIQEWQMATAAVAASGTPANSGGYVYGAAAGQAGAAPAPGAIWGEQQMALMAMQQQQ